MRRFTFGTLVPLLLAVVGVALIIVGQLDLDRPPSAPTLSDIPDPSDTPVAIASPSESGGPSHSSKPVRTPKPTPIPRDWVAVQIQVKSVGINLRVERCRNTACDSFPPDCCAFILQSSAEPGRGTNSYIFAHAHRDLFKPLWNVQVGARVLIRMSDDAVLAYTVTEVHPNVPCPDPDASNPEYNPEPNQLPLALRYAGPGCEEGARWTQPTDHERLTLQTSQGYNRNWGELVVVADPTF
jgi:Sortase domain